MRPISTLLALIAIPVALQAQPDRPTPEQLAGFERRLVTLGQKLLPVTVAVRVGSNAGSGVIVSAEGHVLTAGHLFRRAGQRARITLSDGRRLRGETLGRMERDDYALLKISSEGTWPHAELGVSARLEVGDLCVSTGHPGGYRRGRTPPLRFGRVLATRGRFLRTSSVIDRGDSGGPLFDLDGRVIGIHSRIGRSTTQNWHVPVDRYRTHWKRLLAGEDWGHADFPDGPVIGIKGDGGPDGTIIERIYPDLPAENAGLKVGDRIVKFGGAPVDGMDDLKDMIAGCRPGDRVDVVYLRDGKRHQVEVHLMLSPDAPQKGAAAGQMPVVDDAQSPAITWLEATRDLTAPFEDLFDKVGKSVVTVRSGERGRVLGTIVDPAGLIVTKASELKGEPVCTLHDGRELPATTVATFDAHDVAVLRVKAGGLPAVTLADSPDWKIGRWLLSIGDGRLRGSVVSVLPRPIADLANGGYLGVQLVESGKAGVRITEVVPGSAASKARLSVGDVLLAIEDEAVVTRDDVIALLSSRRAGTRIRLRVQRGDEKLELRATLGSRSELNEERQRPRAEEGSERGRRWRRSSRRLTSQRRGGFELAVQHDAVLRPRECGGPLVDLKGRCVGLNIARESRTSTLALPSGILQRLLEKVRAAGRSPAGTDKKNR